jgi:hypothetical protein
MNRKEIQIAISEIEWLKGQHDQTVRCGVIAIVHGRPGDRSGDVTERFQAGRGRSHERSA